MKQVIAIIRNNKYFETKDALSEAGFIAMNSKDVLGRGKRKVHPELFLKSKDIASEDEKNIYESEMYSKKMLEIYIRDEDEDRLVETILKVNKHSSSGDGKIFIIPLDGCERIRTGEKGDNAIM